MTTAKLKMTTAAAMVIALGLSAPAFAQATEDDGYGDGYQSGAYGRVRSADAGATIVRADGESDEPDAASVNAPLFPGDVLRTDEEQRVEVQLAGGSTVRIDNSGEVVFQSLPNPSAKFQDNTVLALKAGVIRITSRLGEKEEFRIDTPDASVYLLGEGEFRIAIDDRGGTRVVSLRGVAEVVGNEASVLVRGGMGTMVVAGSTPDSPRAYSALASDGFDRWCASRDDAYRVHDRYAQGDEPVDVPDEVRPYYGELSTQGRFDVDPEYGTVWYPTGVASDWRPYYDGYWSYGPGGYFWVSNEPWGWAPYHYGNWQWSSRHRWCWVPGRVFGGAWVSWSWGSLNVGWAPLDFWGRPGWLGGSLQFGFYDPGCWTFVNYNHINDRNIRRYAVPIDRIRDDLRHATVVARAPRVDPRHVAVSREWRDRALRQVVNDHAARMNPTRLDRRPERRLSDVQNHLTRRPVQQRAPSERIRRGTIGTPSVDPRTMAPRPRRILEDPRAGARPSVRPETRDDVRDLYQRMSRPRETRGPDAPAPRADAPSHRPQPRREAPSASRQDDSRLQPRREAPGASRQDDSRFQPRREVPSASRREAPRAQPRREAPSVSRQEPPRFEPRRETPSVSRQAPPRFEPRREAPSASRREAPRAQPRVEVQRSQAQRERAPRAESPREPSARSQAAPRAKEKHGDRH